MTDNELVDLCMTCGCILSELACSTFGYVYFKPGDDVDMTLKSLRKRTSAVVLLPANFHWCSGSCSTASALFTLLRYTENSSWRIFSVYPRIIVREFIDNDGFLNYGLLTTSLESPTDQLKFEEQVNRMSLESLKDLVFGVVKKCSAKTKELRRTEILASSKEWN